MSCSLHLYPCGHSHLIIPSLLDTLVDFLEFLLPSFLSSVVHVLIPLIPHSQPLLFFSHIFVPTPSSAFITSFKAP